MVEVIGGIEGEVVALLPAGVGAAVAVHVGLHPPLAPAHVAQELEVQLVVRLLVHIAVRRQYCIASSFSITSLDGWEVLRDRFGWFTTTHVERDDDARRVVGGQLDGGAEEAVEEDVLRREPGA